MEFEVLVFVEGGKPENQEKNPRNKRAKTNKKTQPTYGIGSESILGDIGQKRVLSSLCHPYSPKHAQFVHW